MLLLFSPTTNQFVFFNAGVHRVIDAALIIFALVGQIRGPRLLRQAGEDHAYALLFAHARRQVFLLDQARYVQRQLEPVETSDTLQMIIMGCYITSMR